MNAINSIDHLQAIAHVTNLLNNSANLSGTATVSKPKSAATTHYDPSGQTAAVTSNTSYEGVSFAADGSISGGSLTHESSVPGGNKISTTSVNFGANGKPSAANITEHNINGEGDFKKIQMDMSGANWNDSFAIASGKVSLTTLDAVTGQKKHDGDIQFSNEAITTGAFTHYAEDGSGTVTGGSQVDYSGGKFLGSNIVGGQYKVQSLTPANAVKSASVIALSDLGRVQSIETTNMGNPAPTAAVSGAIASKVLVDFSNVVFNARNQFDSGEVAYTANDGNEALISKTAVAYANARPSLSTTQVFKEGQLQNKVVIDYAASRFNNDHQVVNSTKKVEVYAGDGSLVSANIISYDARGNKTGDVKAGTQVVTPAPAIVTPQKQATLPPPARLMAAADDGTTQKTDNKNRADGTLEQRRVTTLKAGKPIFAVITCYAADGKTITKSFSMDLSTLAYDQSTNAVSGSMNMQTHIGGTVLNASSSIQY